MEKMGNGIKKRIVQVVILLLFTLGMAAGSFYMVKTEAETAWKIEADDVNADRLIRKLAVRDDWKTVFRKMKAPGLSADEIQELYGAMEIRKIEKEIEFEEPYGEAYYEVLKEHLMNQSSEEAHSSFCLAYIDDDEIPELLILVKEDYPHIREVKVYTYYNGSVLEIGAFGSEGDMLYYEGQGKICSYSEYMGEEALTYYVLKQGEAEKVDDVSSQESLRDFVMISYVDGTPIHSMKLLKSSLAEELERLEKEKERERQQAEAIEAYGDFSGEHGGEWKKFLKDRVLSVSECSEDEILRFEYDDFNGDGNYEAFVFLGKEAEVYEDEIEYFGSFWFVSAKQCLRLDDGMTSYRSIEGSMLWGNQKYVYCITGEVITANISRVWTVRNGKAVESKISGVGEVRYDGKEYLEIVRDAYDGVYDQYSDIMNGHTYKPYFYKYNETIKEFEECTSKEIDEEELKRLCGFDLGVEIKAEGYEILSLLKLENDIVVVNYAIHDEGESPCIYYENVMWDCTTGDYWKRQKRGITSWKDAGFHGTYQKNEARLTREAEAYYGFLIEYYRENPHSEHMPIGFRLVYIDGDNIPELLLMEDNSHYAGVRVYTYHNDKIIEVGGFGSFGGMQYLEKKGMIFSGFYNMGEGWSGFYELKQGVSECICEMRDVDGDAFLEPRESYYEIDGVPVSEEVYEAKWQELWSDEFISIGYNDAVFFTETNLRTLLAQEIEGLKAGAPVL